MKLQWLKAFFSALILWSFLLNSLPVKAQGEIVTSEDISGGSSVFVFRRSSKAPQAKFAPKVKPKRSKADIAQNRKSFNDQAKKVIPPRAKVVAKITATPKPTPKPSPGKPTPKPTPIKTVSPEEASNAMGAGAEVLLDRGEVDKAIAMFKESIKLYPKNELAKGGLSEALTAKADNVARSEGNDLAIPIYEEALKNNPNNAVALAGLGAAYEEMDDENRAFEYYQKAVAVNSNLTELYAPLGIGYYKRGEIEKADELLTKAVAARSDDYQTQYLLGLINYKKNRDPQAEAALKESIKLNKDLAEGYYYLGEIYDRANRPNDAIEQYNKAIQINPKYAEAWFDLGAAYFNRERYEDAINAYSKAIQFNNANYQAHENLADVYRLMGYNITIKSNKDGDEKKLWYQKAEASYRTASDLAEKNEEAKKDRTGMAELYSKFGFVLGRLSKWNASVDALNKALSYNPDAFDYTNLGWAYYNSAQMDKTPKETELNPTSKAKLEKGREALQKAVAMDAKSKAAWMNLGVTQNDLKDYNSAIQSMKKCLELQDDWVPAINELGMAYQGLGDFGEAIKNFRRASDIAEKSLSKVKNDLERYRVTQQLSDGLYNLAYTEKQRGNDKEAKKAQDRLRKYNPAMANRLEAIFLSGVKNKVDSEIQKKNPLNKIKIPY